MNNRICALRRRVASLREPEDYFRGLRRSAEPAPDNIPLFRRAHAADLGHFGSGADSLHERWVLLIALHGRGVLRIDRRPHALAPGRAVLVPPLHLHGYPEAEARLDWLFVTFEWPGHAGRSAEWAGVRSLDAAARARLALLLDEHASSAASGNALSARLLDLLRLLYQTGKNAAPASDAASLLAAVQSAAAEKPDIRVPALARRLGRSESHLRALFRSEAGLSLGRYLRETRLRAAARRLREQGGTVKAAAESAGYPDAFTFSRAFKRVLGVSPVSVRAQS